MELMETVRIINAYFPKVISNLIYDILAHDIADSRDAAIYGVIELIKYPESAFDAITKHCSIDAVKSIFPIVNGKIKVSQMYDAIYHSLVNGRKDIYDIILNHKKIKHLSPEMCDDDKLYKNCTDETFAILMKLFGEKNTYVIHDKIYEYDRVDLLKYVSKPDLYFALLYGSKKIIAKIKSGGDNKHITYIKAYYGDEKSIETLRELKDINVEIEDNIYEIIVIKNKRFDLFDPSGMCLVPRIIFILLETNQITPQEFADILLNIPADDSFADKKFETTDMKLYDSVNKVFIENKLHDLGYSLYSFNDEDKKRLIFSSIYNNEIDEVLRYDLYEHIFSSAAFHNNVSLMKKMYQLGANNFLEAALAATCNNSMDAFLYVKPFVDDFKMLFECAAMCGSHYILLDLMDYKYDVETHDRYTNKLLGRNDKFDICCQYSKHYNDVGHLFIEHENIINWAED